MRPKVSWTATAAGGPPDGGRRPGGSLPLGRARLELDPGGGLPLDAATPIRTFTLGFGEPRDENADASRVAGHFGSEHREQTLDARPLEVFPRVVYHAEMPKVNATQSYYLARFARSQVKVALSGLGGDELFFGYRLYRYLWPAALLVDSPLARLFGPTRPLFDRLASSFDRVAGLPGENPRRGLELAACAGDPLRYYVTLRNGWDLGRAGPRRVYQDVWRRELEHTTRTSFARLFDRPHLPFPEQVQWAELRGKLVDDFLLNEDRMSMASSLEVRVPMLDPEMIRFALSIPYRLRHRGRQFKPVIKRAMASRLPAASCGSPSKDSPSIHWPGSGATCVRCADGSSPRTSCASRE